MALQPGPETTTMTTTETILQLLAALVLVGLYGLPVIFAVMVLMTDRNTNRNK
jgi:hypothetical protein